MKVIHLIDIGKEVNENYKCYCGKRIEFIERATIDARKTNCKGAIRVIESAWGIFRGHEKRRKK